MTSRRTSDAPRKKSSKRSGAKRRPPNPTFYTDECLGRHVPEALISAGYDVRPWYEHHPGQKDVDWLPSVGAAGWAVFTKDKRIRKNPLEIQAILNAGVKAFVLTAAGLRKEEQAHVFIAAMPKIARLCTQRGPFIFNITKTGHMSRISTNALRRRRK